MGRRIIKQAGVDGKSYGLLGDINLVDNRATWCLLFNKNLAQTYVVGDIYEIVRSGNWTMDELKRCCIAAARDLNGDSIMDWIIRYSVASSFIWSCGGRFGKRLSDGNVELTIDSEQTMNALMKSCDFSSLEE